jgi:hypothetical protein
MMSDAHVVASGVGTPSTQLSANARLPYVHSITRR